MNVLKIEVQDGDGNTYESISIRGAKFVPPIGEIKDLLDMVGIEYKGLTIKVTFLFDVPEN